MSEAVAELCPRPMPEALAPITTVAAREYGVNRRKSKGHIPRIQGPAAIRTEANPESTSVHGPSTDRTKSDSPADIISRISSHSDRLGSTKEHSTTAPGDLTISCLSQISDTSLHDATSLGRMETARPMSQTLTTSVGREFTSLRCLEATKRLVYDVLLLMRVAIYFSTIVLVCTGIRIHAWVWNNYDSQEYKNPSPALWSALNSVSKPFTQPPSFPELNFCLPLVPMRLRALFSRQPERQLPSDHLHYAGAGDADPPASTPYRTVANEALRQQQDALENNRDHIRPLVLSSAQGTHSIRVDENSIPHAHGTGINGSLAVQNTDTGLPCVTNGHFQYDFYAAEPGWALDVPMVSADQVRTVLFGSHGPIVSDDCIAATFPVTMFPHSVDDPTRQALVSPTHPAISPSEVFPISQQNLNYVNDTITGLQPALQANEPTKAMVPATCTRCKVHGIHTPQECPDRLSESLAIIAEKSRTQVRTKLGLGVSTNTPQHPYKEELATEWIKRAVNDLYDPSVPASAEKARFRQAFLREQADTWPLPPSDSAWATMDPPHPDCDRCNSEQVHLVTFCPSEFGDSTRIHPLVAVWNAFTPRSLFPTQVSPLINLEFPPARPGTPYPHAQEYNELLQDVPSLVYEPVYTSQLTEEPRSYDSGPRTRYAFTSDQLIAGANNISSEEPPAYDYFTLLLDETRRIHGPDSPRFSPEFAEYLDQHILDQLYDARHVLGSPIIKYPDLSILGPTAYYVEGDERGIKVLRLPIIDPGVEKFLRDLFEGWGYLPRSVDRALVESQLRSATEFSGALQQRRINNDTVPYIGTPERLIDAMFTASRAPFNAPPIIQQYPEQPQSTSAVLGTLEEVRNYRRTPLPWNSANNETWAAAFAAYLDEVVFDNIWAIRRAIGPGSIRYPDISDESNPAYYMETLADSTRVLRIPGLDNIFDALIRHWYFHLFSGNNPFTLLESFIATLDQPMITLSPDPTQPDQGTADPDPTLSVPESFEFPRELDSITFTSDVRGPFTAPLDMEYHPRDPIPGSFILSIPNELLARRAAPSPWNDLGNLYSTEFQDYIDELVFDNIWKIREDIGLNSMKYPDLSDIHNQEYYLQEMGNGERLLRVPGIDRIAEVLGTQFNYVFLANDNSLSLPRSEAWIRQLFLHWDYLPTSVDRERYMQTHPDSEPVPGLSLATSPASTPPSSQSTNSAKSSPTLVPLSPAGTEDSADSFEDYVYKQALKQYTAEFEYVLTLPDPKSKLTGIPSPIFTSRSPTPDSLPDLEPPSSGDEGSCLPTPPPDDPVMQNARYTTSWINRTIIGHDDWSSSSPDSSTSQSSSDIPPYDAELQYPEYAHEPIIVAAMFAPKTEDGDHTELSEPNTPARTIGDDIPGLQTQP
ncbi:hypothetical protein B0H10DRAFT_1968359 [Mycena sp. CBHHK59/15]|nr:hypothetical protein B0H10DRAFT_1968359 [Mycena sp. CBHHK59/15]